MSTIELSRAERTYAEATAAHAEATAKAQQAADRLNDVQARKDAITQRRLAGKSNDRDAAEFVALGADAELLGKMLAAAQQVQAQARDQVTQAAQVVASVKADHQRLQNQAKFDALHAQCKAIEEVFCEALGELGRAGQLIGRPTFGSCFQKSDTLHRCVDLNVCPPKTK